MGFKFLNESFLWNRNWSSRRAPDVKNAVFQVFRCVAVAIGGGRRHRVSSWPGRFGLRHGFDHNFLIVYPNEKPFEALES